MDDIPQEVLYDARMAGTEHPVPFLTLIGQHFADMAERTRALRRKSWQSKSKELDGVAGHIRAYADQLAAFIANNPDGVSLVGEGETRWEDPRDTVNGETDQPVAKGKKAKPQLPGNTGRCASFRRANPDDTVICSRERGHEGDHSGDDGHDVDTWPRTPSGAVCGDVVILPDGTALNCARPLGHDGDEHHDGRYQFWPRGVGTSRYVRTCERCNMDTHGCPGCGEPVGHYGVVCAGCKAREIDDGPIVPPAEPPLRPMTPTELDDEALAMAQEPPLATGDDIFPNQCSSRHDGERCMLPGAPMHTGKHKGTKGTAWDQVAAEPAATLGDIAEQQRATMVIPEQRPASDPVPQLAGPEFVAAAQAAIASTPAGVLVAEMKEEVSAPVATLPNPFAPRTVTEFTLPAGADGGIGAVLGNPFQLIPAPPVEPPAVFLPPHLVPGEPKAHQSHSSITTMEKCGLQYRLKYRDGIGDDTPAWWNVAGTAFHTVVQAIEAAYAETVAAQLVGGPWDIDAPLVNQERVAASRWKAEFAELVERTEKESGKARSTWKAAKGGKEGEAFWREFGGDLARMYVGHRRKFLAEPEGWRLLNKPNGEGWAHEVEFNATVDGVLLNGFIDSVWISADGATILIEDFKSGSSEGDPFQPKLYGAALRALGPTGGRRIVTRFYEARKGAHSATVELTTADDAEVSYRANTAQTMDRAGIFPPSPSGYNCSTCPVKSRCPIMATKGN